MKTPSKTWSASDVIAEIAKPAPSLRSRAGLTQEAKKPANLWEACLKILEAPTGPDRGSELDALLKIRRLLDMFGQLVALKMKQDPKGWSSYAERHPHVGIRFMLRDANGREIDLQTIPGTFEELSEWRP